jgi:hypothetical protein
MLDLVYFAEQLVIPAEEAAVLKIRALDASELQTPNWILTIVSFDRRRKSYVFAM